MPRNRTDVLSYEIAHKLLRYEADTGKLFWRAGTGKGSRAKERLAGSLTKDGYLRVTVNYREQMAHRVAWLLHYGELPTLHLDHMNGVKSDNRINNLRQVTVSENQQNLRRPNSNNKTGYLGVCFYRGKYLATIKLNGKQYRLGKFDFPEDAHAAYMRAKRELHPASTIA